MEPAWNQQVAQVLPLVLQHSPSFSDPADVCRLLRVSAAVNTTVRQSRGHCSVTINANDHNWDDQRVQCFAAWLLRHSGLVAELRFRQSPTSFPDPWRSAVLGALHACAAAATSNADVLSAAKTLATVAVSQSHTAAVLTDDTSQQQQKQHADEQEDEDCRRQREAGAVKEAAGGVRVQPPPLCLDSFETDVFASGAEVQLLSFFGLRRLSLWRVDLFTIDTDFCTAAAQLSTLTELSLLDIDKTLHPEAVGRLVPLAQALGQLPSLAVLNCHMPAAAGHYLPRSLQRLTYAVCQPRVELCSGELTRARVLNVAPAVPGGMEVAAICDLAHLTGLSELKVCEGRHALDDMCQVVLPPAVSVVEVAGALVATGLQRVHKLILLQLRYRDHHAWGSMLSNIAPECLEHVDLSVRLSERTGLPWLLSAANSLARLTGITQLHIMAHVYPGFNVSPDSAPDVAWCASLTALLRLKHLELNVTEFNPSDLANLSVLTALTRLKLQTHSAGLVEAALGTVLSCLPGLQHLWLLGLQADSRPLLPVIAQLTQLRNLWLQCWYTVRLSVDDLLVLSPLKQLTHLMLPMGASLVDDWDAVRAWLADMPHLRNIQ